MQSPAELSTRESVFFASSSSSSSSSCLLTSVDPEREVVMMINKGNLYMTKKRMLFYSFN